MEIDETGIMCEYAGITHKAERHWFTGRYEERDVVILLGRTEGYMAVPRRGFDSASDFEGAVTLVRTKVAAIG